MQVISPFVAAGGQRCTELDAISLMETAANQKKNLNFQKGVQAFLSCDYSKPEGLTARAKEELCWSLPEPYTEQLMRYVIAGTPLLYHLAKILGDEDKVAYLHTRFLSVKGARYIRDFSNRLLAVHNLPKVNKSRHLREWLSRDVGSVMDMEERLGENEKLGIRSSNHDVRTGTGWYAKDKMRKLQSMVSLAKRYHKMVLGMGKEDAATQPRVQNELSGGHQDDSVDQEQEAEHRLGNASSTQSIPQYPPQSQHDVSHFSAQPCGQSEGVREPLEQQQQQPQQQQQHVAGVVSAHVTESKKAKCFGAPRCSIM